MLRGNAENFDPALGKEIALWPPCVDMLLIATGNGANCGVGHREVVEGVWHGVCWWVVAGWRWLHNGSTTFALACLGFCAWSVVLRLICLLVASMTV